MKHSLGYDEPVVFILDSDRETRHALKALVKRLRQHAESYASLEEFLAGCDARRPGCALIDAHLPGAPGEVAVRHLAQRGIFLPVILLAARPEVAVAVRAMKAGAFDFLKKPWQDERLAEAIHDAIASDAANRQRLAYCHKVRQRLERLTPGERRVLELLVDGKSNRAIAVELGVHVRTVEVRRAKVMQKMRARSLAELVRAAVAVWGPLCRCRYEADDAG